MAIRFIKELWVCINKHKPELILRYVVVYLCFKIVLRFICLKHLQNNADECPDFELRFCCDLNQTEVNRDTIFRRKRDIPEQIDPDSIEIEDIQRNIDKLLVEAY